MKLASALSGHFDNDVRARGASYYRLGAVRIKRGNAAEVQAGVRGSRVYDVDISWNGHRLVLFCDCPYYEDVGACKHIWATILAADAQNYFTSITRLNFRDVVFDEAPEPVPNGHHDYDDPPYYAPLSRAVPALKPQPVAAPPIWRQRLNEIVPAGSLAYQTWPAHRELVYIVDVPSSVTRGALILDLKTREPKLKGGWKKPATPQITRATISKLPNPADRHILGVAFRNRHELRLDGLRHIRIVRGLSPAASRRRLYHAGNRPHRTVPDGGRRRRRVLAARLG